MRLLDCLRGRVVKFSLAGIQYLDCVWLETYWRPSSLTPISMGTPSPLSWGPWTLLTLKGFNLPAISSAQGLLKWLLVLPLRITVLEVRVKMQKTRLFCIFLYELGNLNIESPTYKCKRYLMKFKLWKIKHLQTYASKILVLSKLWFLLLSGYQFANWLFATRGQP